jgi:hypothetical protein
MYEETQVSMARSKKHIADLLGRHGATFTLVDDKGDLELSIIFRSTQTILPAPKTKHSKKAKLRTLFVGRQNTCSPE